MEYFLTKLLIKVALKFIFFGNHNCADVCKDDSGEDAIEGGIDLLF